MRFWNGLFVLTSVIVAGCSPPAATTQELSKGVSVKQDGTDELFERLATTMTSISGGATTGPGLIGAQGSTRVKLLKQGEHKLLLPLPQLTETQIPISYSIRSTPRESLIDSQVTRRDDNNDVVVVQLAGERNQEIVVEWCAAVLVTDQSWRADDTKPVAFCAPSSCAQADAEPIKALAAELWPTSGIANEFAAKIQQLVRDMKQTKQPRSLDAIGIRESGANWICTANANLAVALLRAKEIPAYSLAVIPPNSQKLEMHRVVRFFDKDKWVTFDPSSVHAEIPMQPWHSVIMARTTIADEEAGMKLRMGSMLGCAYGQELELLTQGATPWGQDFFWTIAKPFANFQPDDEAVSLAAELWRKYLAEGQLSQGQTTAGFAANAQEFHKLLKQE